MKIRKVYTYDSKGNVNEEIIKYMDINPKDGSFSEKERKTTYKYDSEGKNKVEISNALNQTETRKYNVRNQLILLTGPNGLQTTWEYDEMGRKIKESRADGTYTTWTHYWDNSLENSLYAVREKTNTFQK